MRACCHFSSVQSLSRVRLCDPMNRSTPGLPVHHTLVLSNSVTLWTVAHQGPLSMGFSRPEYWSGLLSSRGSSWVRDRIWVFYISCIGSLVLYHWSHMLWSEFSAMLLALLGVFSFYRSLISHLSLISSVSHLSCTTKSPSKFWQLLRAKH